MENTETTELDNYWKRPWCFLQTIWYTLTRPGFYQDGIPVMGHVYVDQETHDNVSVTVSRCEGCGKVSITWS